MKRIQHKIKCRTDIHNINVRFNGLLAMSSLFQRYFSDNIVSECKKMYLELKTLQLYKLNNKIRRI